ncbi:hypothetical protein GCM10011403_29310 [Pseudohongiella nitratireducens]|uniref:Uncharacterized protein n=1 Tax=Pseudohongiella nitratireducens TaxID=1768907 RepID=A0A916VJT9_9GAMM|nr:hypothetical protein [Pseudohongiella nitratireducens]GFZ83858.1 hypothetical protein GCM10011403_29310 [Pseudohongiella nitratireducens]
MEAELFKLLAGAGDVATVAILLMFWRIDKRVSRLEWQAALDNS